MGTTYNIITPSNSLVRFNSSGAELSPTGYSHSWTISGATMTVVAEKFVYPLQYSLKVQPTTEISTVVLTLTGMTSNDITLYDDDIQFHARYFSGQSLTISTSLLNVQTNTTTVHVDTTTASEWSTGYSAVSNAGGVAVSFNVVITISEHAGNEFYLSLPTLISDSSFYRNAFVRNLRKNIPSFIWDKDGLEEYPTYPFYKLFHVLTSRANDAAQLYSDMYGFNAEEIPPGSTKDDGWTKSNLVHPEAVSPEYLSWLGQFTGSNILRGINVSGSEIISANSIDADDFVLWQLENSYFGWASATTSAIRESVQQILTGAKVCYVFPTGPGYTINIYTVLSETPGAASNGATSTSVLALANLTRPLGFIVNHAAYTTLPMLLDDAVYGLLDVAPLG